MNKVAKANSRSKPKTKASSLASAVKPAKKRSKVSALAAKPVKKAVRDTSEPKPTVVPLAEVEVLAAKAEKLIKSARKLSAAEKARKLTSVARSLENAKKWGGLSKCGAFGLTTIHVPPEPYDRSVFD